MMNTSNGTFIKTFVVASYYGSLEQGSIIFAGCLLSTFTICGNLLVAVAYYTHVRLRTLTNLFIFSLSISDILVGVFSINFYFVYVALKGWPLGPVVCDIWLCLDYVCCQASVIHIIIISVDRYLSIIRPLTYRIIRTRKRAYYVIFVIWIIALVQWAPWIVSYPYIKGHRNVPSNACYVQFLAESTSASILTACAAYYIPVFILAFVYVRTYSYINKQDIKRHVLRGPRDRRAFSEPVTLSTIKPSNDKIRAVSMLNDFNTKENNTNASPGQAKAISVFKQKKAAKMLSLMFLAFSITWLPYHVLAVLAPFYPTCISQTAWDLSYVLCYFNSTINPLCYAMGHKGFRAAFKSLLLCKRRKHTVCVYRY